jgi:hypothetical protein
MSLIHGSLAGVTAFQRSLTSGGAACGSGFVLYCAALAALAAAVLALLAWHAVVALRHSAGKRELVFGLLVPRLLTLGLFGLYLLLAVPAVRSGGDGDADGRYHLHHWWLAWMASLIFFLNAPLSAVPLAVATAAFVQGCAAYNVAPLVVEDSCVWFEGVGGLRLTADLSLPAPFANATLLCEQPDRRALASFDLCLRRGAVGCVVLPAP